MCDNNFLIDKTCKHCKTKIMSSCHKHGFDFLHILYVENYCVICYYNKYIHGKDYETQGKR